MKKSFLLLPLGFAFLASCGNSTNNDALNQIMDDKDDFDAATVSFEDGGATNGEEYFFGVQAEVVEIDVKLREVENLDEQDATTEEFGTHFDTMLVMIDDCKKAMKQYEGKGWPKQDELQALTVEWVDAVKGLINDHLKPLAAPMSIPDDQWEDADFEKYDAYLVAYETYLEVDSRWVDFQYEFASANGFQLSDETIDMDALIEEDMGH
jgi:hypothetical protein